MDDAYIAAWQQAQEQRLRQIELNDWLAEIGKRRDVPTGAIEAMQAAYEAWCASQKASG